jgi:RimJ/RimL family protein N-acetyltransferase
VTLHFEPLAEAHLAAVALAIEDPDSERFTRFPPRPDHAFLLTWLERYEQGRRDGTREGFAVLDARGVFVGLALAPRIDVVGGEMELGYVVTPAARGRGIGSAILAQLSGWAFDECRAERLELQIDVDNVASMLVAARNGFVLEGVRRGAHVKGDQRADVALWARLAGDAIDPDAADELPHWPDGAVALLATGAGAAHVIPVSTALRAGPRVALFALAHRRASLARLRRDPRVALAFFATDVACTAHGLATVVADPLPEAPGVCAIRFDVLDIQDHRTPRFTMTGPVPWEWTDPESRERDATVRTGLRRLASRPESA